MMLTDVEFEKWVSVCSNPDLSNYSGFQEALNGINIRTNKYSIRIISRSSFYERTGPFCQKYEFYVIPASVFMGTKSRMVDVQDFISKIKELQFLECPLCSWFIFPLLERYARTNEKKRIKIIMTPDPDTDGLKRILEIDRRESEISLFAPYAKISETDWVLLCKNIDFLLLET